MKTLSAAERKNNIKKASTNMDAAVEALTAAVSEDLASENGFGDFECAVLEKSNEICRRVLSKKLKDISHQCEDEFFFDKRR
jgi:predicted hotdog family 3-hydroxylacyl-ACP dehydratase